jgi:hypothetical protein
MGSAIATIAAYGSMMSIPTTWGTNIIPFHIDLKIGAISRYHILFQPYPFTVSENYYELSFSLNRLPYILFYSNEVHI